MFLRLAYGEELKTDEQVLSNYVEWFFKNVKPRYTRKALEYVPIVVRECEAQNWDPLLVGVMISGESTWRSGITSESSLAEQGLMQVHGRAAEGYDLSDPVQEVRAGVSWLSECREVCGDELSKILSCYGTGSCNKTHLPFIRRRLRVYRKMTKKFRN